MPKPANPLVQISKRLASLQAKSQKMNEEINALVALVATEAQKQADAAPIVPASAAKPVPAKKVAAKAPAKTASDAPKKRGRPSKK